MEYQMSGFSNLCGTCEYWVGPRQPNSYASHVILASQSVNGKCMCPNAPWARADKLSNVTACNCYKKWAILK